MTDQLLNYYHEELSYLRQSGEQFAQAHPKTAGALRLDGQGADDPLVSRLLESFAFLTAKVNAQVGDDYQVFAHALLQLLYPSALLPIPSLTTVQYVATNDLTTSLFLPRHTKLQTTQKIDELCYFKTVYPVEVAPLTVTCSRLFPIADLPSSIQSPSTSGAFFKISFSSSQDDYLLNDRHHSKMRLYINAYKAYANSIYAYLFNHQVGGCAVNQDLSIQKLLVEKPFSPVGFSIDELLWPLVKPAFLSFQIFSEYTSFPAKHMYLDLLNFNDLANLMNGCDFDYYVFLDQYTQEFDKVFNPSLFLSGCTPVVNLFDCSSQSLSFDHQSLEHVLQPDINIKRSSIEIYDIVSFSGWRQDGSSVPCERIHQHRHQPNSKQVHCYWEMLCQQMWVYGDHDLKGREVLLRMNSHLGGELPWQGVAQLLCTNRDAPSRANLCQQGNELRLVSGFSDSYQINCLHHPTPVFRSTVKQDQLMILLSTLVASHDQLFISDGQWHEATLLKRHLYALNLSGQVEINYFIDHIKLVRCQRVSQRYPDLSMMVYVQGMKIGLKVDLDESDNKEHYLFSMLLRQLIQFYCPLNSFIIFEWVNATTNEVIEWPAVFH